MFDVRRREFIGLRGVTPAACPLAARAQEQPAVTVAERPRVVGTDNSFARSAKPWPWRTQC
jgi:hypothetical protein